MYKTARGIHRYVDHSGDATGGFRSRAFTIRPLVMSRPTDISTAARSPGEAVRPLRVEALRATGAESWPSPIVSGRSSSPADLAQTDPAIAHIDMNVELIEQPRRGEVDEVVDRLRFGVERRHRRYDDHAHSRQLEHVLEVNLAERRFTNRQHQPAALLQHDVGGAMNEV